MKRPIYKIPCKEEGCKIVVHTRSFNRKRCHKHGANAKNKLSQKTIEKRKLWKSPYGKMPKKIRNCLKCGNKFESFSINNRICIGCNKENDNVRGAKSFHGWKLSKGEGFLDSSVTYDGVPICFAPGGGRPTNEF